MSKITVVVEPKDGTFVGWDVRIFSWERDLSKGIWRTLNWTGPDSGKFTGESADLPAGEYGLHAGVIGAGRQIKIKVKGSPTIVQPAGATWPVSLKVDSGTATQNSETWYFKEGEA